MSLKDITAQIEKCNNFLITTHVNSEGDALGSQLAFYRLIKRLDKNAIIVNEDNLPFGYDFLPEVNRITKYKPDLKARFDCMVTVDCSDLKRTGEVYKLNTLNKPVINIDHHISNAGFGDVNWVNAAASSCSEMIYELYKDLRVDIDKETALLIYTGIMTDTGSFRYSNTSSRTHEIVSDLLKHDVDVSYVYRKIYWDLPFRDLQLIAKILNGMKRRHDGKIVWFQVGSQILKKHKTIYADLTDSVLGFGRAVKGAEVVLLFKENLGVKNEVRVNFRSQGKVDVNKIANLFGGGGHKAASGCTVHDKIDNVRRKVLKKVEEEIINLKL